MEIGAGTTIDRGTYDATVIGDGTKIDNQVMIGHNCRMGKHNLICSQVGIAGSCTTGDYVVMAGQVGLSDHLHIGNRAILGAKAGLMNDVPDGAVFIGVPATPERDQWRMWGHVRQAARHAPATEEDRSSSWTACCRPTRRRTGRSAGGRRPPRPGRFHMATVDLYRCSSRQMRHAEFAMDVPRVCG